MMQPHTLYHFAGRLYGNVIHSFRDVSPISAETRYRIGRRAGGQRREGELLQHMLWDGKDIFKTAVTIKPISSSSAFLPQQTSPIVERHKHLGEQERNKSQWVQRYRQKRAAWQEERAHERHLLSVSKSAGAVPLMNPDATTQDEL